MIVVLKQYSWSLHFLTIALCSFLLAQSISTFVSARLETVAATVEPVAPAVEREIEGLPEETGQELAVITQRNIFNSQAAAETTTTAMGEVTPEMLGEMGPAVKTSLGIQLLGALVVGDGMDRRSSATVSDSSRKVDVYYVGEEKSFGTNVRLTKVMTSRIEFLNGSRLEYAEIEDFSKKQSIFASAGEVHGERKTLGETGESAAAVAPAVATEGEKMTIDQGAIDDALSNLDRFYTEVRIVPNFKGGKVEGMKVLSVKPGSVISKLGIRRGDILAKINGQELDVKRGMELFNELKDQKNFTIELVRGGQSKTLEYEIR